MHRLLKRSRMPLLTVAVLIMCVNDAGAQQPGLPPPEGVKFEVVSVRRMSAEEARRRSPSDVFGLDTVVRLRLSSSGSGVFILTIANPIHLVPEGHAVKMTPNGVVWRYGSNSGGESPRSPGSQRICGTVRCEWVRLPSHSALEWELLDAAPSTEETRAFTVFLRTGDEDAAVEVMSTSYDARAEGRSREAKR